MPTGIAVPVDGGYRIKGAWDYSSGCELATHFIGLSIIQAPNSPGPLGAMMALFDRDQYQIVDNWHVFGMQGTSSRRVVVEEIVSSRSPRVDVSNCHRGNDPSALREAFCTRIRFIEGGSRPCLSRNWSPSAWESGAGRLDIYEEILNNKPANYAPFRKRSEEPEFQRHYGEARSLVDTAEAALLQMTSDYIECTRREAEEGVPFSEEQDRRFLQIEQQCVRLCWEAVDLMFRTSGTSAAAKTAPLGRYFRSLAVIRTHITTQRDHTAVNSARLHFGLPALSRL